MDNRRECKFKLGDLGTKFITRLLAGKRLVGVPFCEKGLALSETGGMLSDRVAGEIAPMWKISPRG